MVTLTGQDPQPHQVVAMNDRQVSQLLDAIKAVFEALEPLPVHLRRRAVDAALSMSILGSVRMTPERESVLAALNSSEPTTAAALAKATGKQATNVHNLLNRLEKDGLAKKTRAGWWVTVKP